jgi:hypothetical protein
MFKVLQQHMIVASGGKGKKSFRTMGGNHTISAALHRVVCRALQRVLAVSCSAYHSACTIARYGKLMNIHPTAIVHERAQVPATGALALTPSSKKTWLSARVRDRRARRH